jgi:hypothetical protein
MRKLTVPPRVQEEVKQAHRRLRAETAPTKVERVLAWITHDRARMKP